VSIITDRLLERGWAKAFVEVILVAAGVGLAFSVDSLAAGRRDRGIERGYLERLETEFRSNFAEADSAVAAYELSVRAIGQLQHHISGSPTELADDSVSALMQNSFNAFYFTANEATYAALVGSGELGVLQSDSLRMQLAAWEADLRLYEVFQQKELLSWVEVVEPYFIERLSISHIWAGFLGADFPPSPFKFDYDDVLRDPQLWNILSMKVLHATDMRRGAQILVDRAETVLDLISRERRRFNQGTP
jgi:hypothetical protein